MKKVTLFAVAICCFMAIAQSQTTAKRPTYCDGLPATYEKGSSAQRPPLPKFNTQSYTEYKVQVAILRETHPEDFPFHPDLIARYRPCEEVWVIESRQSFANRDDAEALRDKLRRLGYTGAYLIEMIGYR